MKRIHLRVLRERKHLTQQQLADSCGMPQARISALETSISNPSFDTAVIVAAALDIDPRVLKFGPMTGERVAS